MRVNGVHIGGVAGVALLNAGLSVAMSHGTVLHFLLALVIGATTLAVGHFGWILDRGDRMERWMQAHGDQLNRIEEDVLRITKNIQDTRERR